MALRAGPERVATPQDRSGSAWPRACP